MSEENLSNSDINQSITDELSRLFKDERKYFSILLDELKKFPIHEITNLSTLLPKDNHFSKLEQLERLRFLDQLASLEDLQKLDNLNQLEHLEKLELLNSLKGLANLDKLSNLDSLQNLDRLESLKSMSELTKLEDLKNLSKLSSLDELSKLTELRNLNKLENLNKLKSLDKIEDFSQAVTDLNAFLPTDDIVQLLEKHKEMVKYLSKLDSLENLNSLEQLDNLTLLSSLNQLDSLASLNKLKQLESLDQLSKLKILEKIDQLSQLSSLDKLNNLEKLTNLDELKKLEELSHLENLDKLESLSLLKDDRVDETLTRINNISFLKDSTKVYAIKYFTGMFLDFLKIAAVALAFLYFVQTDFGRGKTNSALAQLGFGNSTMTSFALDYLSRTSDEQVFKSSYDKALAKVDQEILDLKYMNTNQFLSPKISLKYRSFDLYKFKYKHFDLQTDTAQKLDLFLIKQFELFQDYFIYTKNKELHSPEDRSLMTEVSIFLKNKKYQEALSKLLLVKDRSYQEIVYAARVATLGLHLESPEKLESTFSKMLE
jgi:hypothetical protein